VNSTYFSPCFTIHFVLFLLCFFIFLLFSLFGDYSVNICCFYAFKFADPPPAEALCCNMKRRVPCKLKNKNLDKDPYTCRQLGCCFDGNGGQKVGYGGRRRRGYGGGRRRRRPGRYGRPGYRYARWQPKKQPRCFKTRRSKQTISVVITLHVINGYSDSVDDG